MRHARAADTETQLIAGLAAAGVRLTRVAPHERSLEELYLRVRHR